MLPHPANYERVRELDRQDLFREVERERRGTPAARARVGHFSLVSLRTGMVRVASWLPWRSELRQSRGGTFTLGRGDRFLTIEH